MVEKYYEEELRYLYESGKEFAKAHPQRAQLLNIDAVGDRDPYVERLFEGFAFLTARVRETIDSSYGKLTSNLVGLLWPQLLTEMPSISMVQFTPRKGFLHETRVIKRGAQLRSGQVGPENAFCVFTTTADMALHPLSLIAVTPSVDAQKKAALQFSFAVDGQVDISRCALQKLRLHIYAESPAAYLLHELLTTAVASTTIAVDGSPKTTLPYNTGVAGGGFDPAESLLGAHQGSFLGYSIIREYFAFPEKFMCIDLLGIAEAVAHQPGAQRIDVTVRFNTNFPADVPLTIDTFRLNCCPVINLFWKTIEPVNHTGTSRKYRLHADLTAPFSHSVHSVTGVSATASDDNESIVFRPMHSFAAPDPTARTYGVEYGIGPDGRRHSWLILGSRPAAEAVGKLRETISVTAQCTNGTLPRDEVREGAIINPGPDFPDFVSFTNITRPSSPVVPPPDDLHLWTFLAHLSTSLSSVASAETLAALLRIYQVPGDDGQARHIEGIAAVSLKPVRRMIRGGLCSGNLVTITITESCFVNSGDIRLFGSMLHMFFSVATPLTTFVELELALRPSGRTMHYSQVEGFRCAI